MNAHPRRALGAVVAAAVALGSAACEPASGGGLSPVAVAVTTDRTGTATFERIGFDVRWLTCTASVRTATPAPAPTPTPTATSAATASVDCQGETGDGQDITLKGTVTDERWGTCIHGKLMARIGGKIVFEATMLGNCASPPPGTPRPARPGDGPSPGVTVTVTVTTTVNPPDK